MMCKKNIMNRNTSNKYRIIIVSFEMTETFVLVNASVPILTESSLLNT